MAISRNDQFRMDIEKAYTEGVSEKVLGAGADFIRNYISKLTYVWDIYPPINVLKEGFLNKLSKKDSYDTAVNLCIALQDSRNVKSVVAQLNQLADAWKSKQLSADDFKNSAEFKAFNQQLKGMADKVEVGLILDLTNKASALIKLAEEKNVGIDSTKDTKSTKGNKELKKIKQELEKSNKGKDKHWEVILYDHAIKANSSLGEKVWSFYKNKLLAEMHDGALVTNPAALLNRIEMLDKESYPFFLKAKNEVVDKLPNNMPTYFKKRLDKIMERISDQQSFEAFRKEASNLEVLSKDMQEYAPQGFVNTNQLIEGFAASDQEVNRLKTAINLFKEIQLGEKVIDVHGALFSLYEQQCSDKQINSVIQEIKKINPNLETNILEEAKAEAEVRYKKTSADIFAEMGSHAAQQTTPATGRGRSHAVGGLTDIFHHEPTGSGPSSKDEEKPGTTLRPGGNRDE